MKQYKLKDAFTLMEMLLVTSLVSLVAVAVFGVFNNGLRLWAKGVALDHEGQMAIAIDKIGQDLRSTVAIDNIPFNATEMRMAFPSLVMTEADKNSNRAKEGIIDQIGAIEYRFEPGEGKIYRRQANYAQALKKQWSDSQEIMAGIEEFKLSFYYSGSKGFVTKSQAQGQVPVGVIIQMRLHGDDMDRWTKHFYAIPVGG